MPIIIKQVDITTLNVDAIVNAANCSLLGGGGVDGAIHSASGPELLEACKLLKGCETGQAKLTPGFKLPARYVIHTVGPIWRGGSNNEANLLNDCYRNSFELALENKLKTIAFPAISAGIYGYPLTEAAIIAINIMRSYEEKFEQITACCRGDEIYNVYVDVLNNAIKKK